MSGIPQATLDAGIVADEYGYQTLSDLHPDEVAELARIIRRQRAREGYGRIDCIPRGC